MIIRTLKWHTLILLPLLIIGFVLYAGVFLEEARERNSNNAYREFKHLHTQIQQHPEVGPNTNISAVAWQNIIRSIRPIAHNNNIATIIIGSANTDEVLYALSQRGVVHQRSTWNTPSTLTHREVERLRHTSTSNLLILHQPIYWSNNTDNTEHLYWLEVHYLVRASQDYLPLLTPIALMLGLWLFLTMVLALITHIGSQRQVSVRYSGQ